MELKKKVQEKADFVTYWIAKEDTSALSAEDQRNNFYSFIEGIKETLIEYGIEDDELLELIESAEKQVFNASSNKNFKRMKDQSMFIDLDDFDKSEDLVSLAEYAGMYDVTPDTVRQKALRGGFKTAKKIGRNWLIDRNEPYVDLRKK